MTAFAISVASAEAHLVAGRHVLIRGDVGSGKTAVLEEVVRRAKAIDRPVLHLHAVPAIREHPLGLFLSSPEFLDAAEGRPNATTASAWLRGVLSEQALIAIDDAADADRLSLSLIVTAARQSGALLVWVHPSAERDRYLLTRSAGVPFSEVAQGPLGIRGVNVLMIDHAGGPLEASFVADLTTWSAGNARTATTLFDAGVHAGSVQRTDGVWVNAAGWEGYPFDDVAPGLLAALTPEEEAAVRLLAWTGAIPLRSAERIIGSDELGALTTMGRIVTNSRDPASTVVVSPPALTRALLNGMGPLEGVTHSRTVERILGDAERPPVAASGSDWWQQLGDESGSELPDSITFLTQRMQPRVTALWSEWLETPDVSHALRLLRVLMVYMADAPRLSRIFAETLAREESDPEDVAAFLVLSYQWELWTGRIADDAQPHLPAGWEVGAWERSISYAVAELLQPLRRGQAITEVVDRLADPPPGLHNTVQLLRAEAFLERGLPAEADSAAAEGDKHLRGPSDLLDRLDAVRGDALLASGSLADATSWFRAHLAAGYDLGDAFTVKVHARGLATALLVVGDSAGAWRAVSAALRIGRPGPLSASLDERLFGIAATLCARRGDLALAKRFIDELERVSPLVRPRFDIMQTWATSELSYASTPEDAGASESLWEAGSEQIERGATLPGLLCWTLIGAPLPEDRLAQLLATRQLVRAPVLDPGIRLHRAIVQGDPERILRSLRRFTVGGPLETCAFRIVGELWRADEARAELDADSVERFADARVAARWEQAAAPAKVDPAALTDRERQVLDLARKGRSNREIAGTLFVSVRTVENHLYRARQKTGMGRSD